jgi:tetratricopeptide (TPR) repeat protein
MGWYALAEDDLPSARSHFTEALQISREVGDRLAVAFNCAGLGRTANAVGEHEEARKLLEESLAIGRELGSQWLVAFALWLLGRAAYGQQRHELASSHFEESLGAARTLGSRRLIAASLVNLGYIALDQGDPAAARSLGREGLEAAASQSPAIVIGLELMACIAVAEGEPVAAARLLGAVEAAGEQPERDRTPREREIRDRALAAARAAAGDEAFAVAWAEGRAMALEVAIENALED